MNIAINGFGRIGRYFLRAFFNEKPKGIKIVAINDLASIEQLVYLLKYDSAHGKFKENVSYDKNSIIINNKKIKVYSEKDPRKLPWKKHNIDVVIESTGLFVDPLKTKWHLEAGAKKAIVSAPCKCTESCPNFQTTILMGVNEKTYNPKKHFVISNGSCTTNCVAPIVKIIDEKYGIKEGFFTTIHAYTISQKVVDGPSKDFRRGRAAAVNIVPTTTGAASTVVKVLPKLKGKIDGTAMRVPVVDGSITDFTLVLKKKTTVEKFNKSMKNECKKKYKGIVEYSEEQLVSTDILDNPHSAIFDSLRTQIIGNTLKISVWYDNEAGYCYRMMDMLKMIK